jgi:REP-associated tyrosine transposase
MREWQSQTHVRWYCRYHIVIVPKYRKKAIYGALRKNIGPILNDLCHQFGVELIEGHAMPDYVHFWSTGYCVSTVGLDEEKIRNYIRNQEEKDRWLEQSDIFE